MGFRALVTDKTPQGAIVSRVETLDEERLPPGDVTIAVRWAGFNYKDGLCLTGGGALVRTYPHVAGIDFAGAVLESADPRYRPGDEVILTGWRVGETRWGGYAERARVEADWLVPVPKGLDARTAMVLGTAGLSAMLAIDRLEAAGLTPEAGEVLVTGAAGGVGSIAVQLLARLGYRPVALSGRPEHAQTLTELGASGILARADFLAAPDRPLESARWAAAIDAVGGPVLGKLLRQIAPHGAVAAIGNAGGIELTTNVLPFILRGISLLGIDSVTQPYAARVRAWNRLAELFDAPAYETSVTEIGLEDLPEDARRILAGEVAGRRVVKVGG